MAQDIYPGVVALETNRSSIIPTEETVTSTTYVEMPTPDRVTGVVVPRDGIVVLAFQGMWKESVQDAARVAIFIGSNQLKVAQLHGATPIVQEARNYGGAGIYKPLNTAIHGLLGSPVADTVVYTGDVTTGQVLGATDFNAGAEDTPHVVASNSGFGAVSIYLPAGTYDFSIRFKSSSGSVTAKERKLFVKSDAASVPALVGSAVPPAYVTSLPSAPTDGQEVYYAADAANGVIWHLRYRAAASGSYKWDVVGGPPLHADVLTGEATASASYVALTTAGPSVTVPLAGDYIVHHGFRAYSAGNGQKMSYDIGGTAAVDADAVHSGETGVVTGAGDSGSRTRRRTLAAATALVAKYRSPGSQSSTYSDRFLSVTPIRLG